MILDDLEHRLSVEVIMVSRSGQDFVFNKRETENTVVAAATSVRTADRAPAALEQMYHFRPNKQARLRAHGLLLLDQGYCFEEVAQILLHCTK